VSSGDRSDEDRRQQHGFVFEACKHFTTLNTAAALVVVVLHRDPGLYLWPLPFFGVSLVASLYGVFAIATLDVDREAGAAQANVSLVIATITFFVGVVIGFAGVINL
jgi:hypothetical protein